MGYGPTPPLTHARRHRRPHSASVSPPPLRASPTSHTAMPVSRIVPLAHTPRQPHHRALSWRADAAVRSTPQRLAAPIRPVPIGAGWAGAISAPTAIPLAVP